MQPFVRAAKPAFHLVLAALCLLFSRAEAQTNYYSANGAEYSIVGALGGDQITPSVALSTNGGYLVWADNATDGSSWGISASKLDSTLSGSQSVFRVNVDGTGAQENPKVAMLQNGGAVFVWQGGRQGFQHIWARCVDASGVFTTGNDILVCSSTNYTQINPSVAVLNNGNIIVTWQSGNQVSSTSLQDVYGQILTPTGSRFGSEFIVNQFTAFNQRSPVVAAQPNGGFIVTWVSEQQRILAGTNSTTQYGTNSLNASVDIYARYFNASAIAQGNEFLVDVDNNICSNPSLAVASDGSYAISWTAVDRGNITNGMDIYARFYNSAGTPGSVVYVNSRIYGDEYVSKISAIGQDFLITWTSLGQDGSREGVYSRFLHNNGAYNSSEFRVNTTTVSQQMEPCVASDGNSQFIVVWRSFTGLGNRFDLFAQRYLNLQIGVPAMAAPFVWSPFLVVNNSYQPTLSVTWSPLVGLSVSNYEVYIDGASVPTGVVSSNAWTMTAAHGLTVSSTHSFRVDYVLTDGRRSPLSPSASGTTWSGGNYYGLPFEWIQTYYGMNFASWPQNVNAPLIPGGYSLMQVFLTGGNPTNSATWLKPVMSKTPQGTFVTWNTTPGATYQVLQTTNLSTWFNYGSARFAAGTSDSINVGGNSKGYYRVVLMR